MIGASGARTFSQPDLVPDAGHSAVATAYDLVPMSLGETLPGRANVTANFVGYTRYSRLARGGPLVCGRSGQWRQQASDFLIAQAASCFWRALVWVVTEDAWDEIMFERSRHSQGFSEAMTTVGAEVYIQQQVLRLSVRMVRFSGAIEVRGAGNRSAGVCWVPLSDASVFAPHWLPYTSCADMGMTWSMRDLAALLATEPPPAQRDELLDRQAELERVEQAPAPQPAFPTQAEAEQMLESTFGFVTARTPPHPAAQPGVVQVAQTAAILGQHLWTDRADVPVGRMQLHRGRPSAYWMARPKPGYEYRFCFEFSPSAFLGAEITTDDIVFWEHAERHPAIHGLTVYQQYDVAAVSSILTDHGVWSLHSPVSLEWSGRHFTLARLQVAACGLGEFIWNHVPFVTATVESIQLLEYRRRVPQQSEYPTVHAWLLAYYAILARSVPSELVGPLNIMRNEELGQPEYSGRDPAQVARALVEMSRATREDWEGIPALALTVE